MDIPPPGPGSSPQQPGPGEPQQPSARPRGPYEHWQPDGYPQPYGYRPPAPYPYPGPYPGPYGPGLHLPPVNGAAIASLVLGILCFLPGVGLVLGLVALAQIRRKGERGKGMAVAGSVLSSVGLVLLAVFIATGAADDFADGFREGVRDSRNRSSTFSLTKGDCFDSPGGRLTGVAYDVRKVSCAGRHDGEVFASYTMAGGGFPGDDKITGTADEHCYAQRRDYTLDAWAIADDVAVYYFTPTEQSWRSGDREITCLYGSAGGYGGLTGSLRRDDTTLNEHQVVYLRAANLTEDALESAPEERYADDDLPGHRAWAERVRRALVEQRLMLRRHGWPVGADQPVAGLLRDLDTAREEWSKAAKATDADDFHLHYVKGAGLIDGASAVTSRRTLDLETTPPGGRDGDDRASGGGPGRGAAV